MLTYDETRGHLVFAAEHGAIGAWRLAVEAGGRRLEIPDARVEVRRRDPLALCLTFAEPALAWELHVSHQGDSIAIESTLHNAGPASFPLGKVYLLDAAGPIRPGQGAGTVCLPLSGELGPRLVHRLAAPDCPRASKIKLQLFDPAAGQALQVGFLTFQRANTEVEHAVDDQGRLRSLRAWCDFAGWELDPGQRTPVETFVLAAGTDPYRQLEAWAEAAAARCQPRRWEDAPIGWVGWAWVDPLTVERYEDVVLRNCRAIRHRLAGFGVGYVWVSIANLEDGRPGDWLAWNWELFPSGPERFGQSLRELGFRWGLWCAPFWVCSSCERALAELGEALLRDDHGQPMVVRGEWQFGSAGRLPRAQRPCVYALDPSHPRTLAALRRTFAAYRAWGVRYYMLDFLHAGAGSISSFPYREHHDRRLVAGPEAYHHALRVVRQAAGDDTYFLSSSGPSVHNAGRVDAIRTGSDFGEGRPLYPDSYFYPATYVLGTAYWTGPRRALENQAAAYYTHRRLYLNDSGNVLTVDKPIPLEAARMHATVHALSGGPSMLGDDIERIEAERLALIKKTLPRPRDVAFPVDLFAAPAPDYPKLFHRRIERPWGRFDVLAVYNFDDTLLRREVPLADLGLDPAGHYVVWEFWNEEYRGRVVGGSLVAEVPPGSVRVYRLAAAAGAPVLLGTDMHLTMGEMEIDRCAWEPATLTLRGTARRPEGEQGSIFVWAPKGLCVAAPQGLWIAKDARDEALLIRICLRFGTGPADWEVRFAPLAGGRRLAEQNPA